MFKGFDRRLASFLVAEYDRTGSATIKLTHEAIAGYISSAREVVARMVKRFSDEGWIEQKRGAIKLLDIDTLRELS
jgi:CRP/FNR family transcriptional regulator